MIEMLNWYEKIIAKRMVKRLAKEIEMGGWKMKLAGVAAILTGAGAITNSLLQGDFSGMWEGWLILVGGLGGLGLGHKLEKLRVALLATPPPPQAERSRELTG